MPEKNTGYLLITFLCCIWPLIGAGIGIAAHKRYLRRGISGFIPKIRTEGLFK